MVREFRTAIDRRTFLVGGAAWIAWPGIARAAHHEAGLAAETEKLLENSPFVYVSPLRGDGSESRCHGEVWYAWFDGAVYLNSESGTWKARALVQGLSGARVWVGDHGRWKSRIGANNEDFRKAPFFDAKVERVAERAANERLLEIFDAKYPGSIDRWRGKMRDGFDSGDRVLLRYAP